MSLSDRLWLAFVYIWACLGGISGASWISGASVRLDYADELGALADFSAAAVFLCLFLKHVALAIAEIFRMLRAKIAP